MKREYPKRKPKEKPIWERLGRMTEEEYTKMWDGRKPYILRGGYNKKKAHTNVKKDDPKNG